MGFLNCRPRGNIQPKHRHTPFTQTHTVHTLSIHTPYTLTHTAHRTHTIHTDHPTSHTDPHHTYTISRCLCSGPRRFNRK